MTYRFSRIVRLLTIPALLAMAALSAPTASAGNPCFHGYEMPSSTTSAGTDVKLMPCAFDPTITVIAVGDSVSFINGPDSTHFVTGAGQAWGSAEVEVQPNETATYTFDTAGVYPYACSLHPGMSGAIVVGDLADAVAAGVADSAAGATGTGTANAANEASAAPAGANQLASDAMSTTAASDSSISSAILPALGVAAGLLAGLGVALLTIRRRSTTEGALARAE